jgi:murein DD-endopeptidase MepM/ murein hydrolase activator NlpD
MKHLFHPGFVVLCFASLLLSGCQATQETGTPFTPSPVSATPTPANIPASPTLIIESTPTQPVETPTFQPTDLPAPFSATSAGPIQLFFPTAEPAEGAEYRPPIYPVPWALSPYDHFYFVRPISAYYPAEPVEDYRYGGIYFGPNTIHTGIDLPAPRGTNVLAAGPGTVVWAGYGLYAKSTYQTDDPYGLAVAIRHDFGYNDQPLFTIYAHMEEVDVTVGQWVNTSNIIGKVGSTGFATGPHLHFEVRLGDDNFYATRNPELWIAPPQGYGVLAGRIMDTNGLPRRSFSVILKNPRNNREYTTSTYAELNVHPDSYYDENFVLGDLPAGVYELLVPYAGLPFKEMIQILPGQVTYFSFHGYMGFDFSAPIAPELRTPTP